MFIRPHLDCSESFHQHFESIQYNAEIAITGTIRETSSEKLLQELGLKTLKSRRWFRKLCLIANNNIGSVILEIKTTDVKSLKH